MFPMHANFRTNFRTGVVLSGAVLSKAILSVVSRLYCPVLSRAFSQRPYCPGPYSGPNCPRSYCFRGPTVEGRTVRGTIRGRTVWDCTVLGRTIRAILSVMISHHRLFFYFSILTVSFEGTAYYLISFRQRDYE